VIPALGKQKQGDHELEASLGYIVRPCLKKKKKKSGRVAQEVECLPWKNKAQSSNLSTIKKKKKKK
jgi:hypothetical protein